MTVADLQQRDDAPTTIDDIEDIDLQYGDEIEVAYTISGIGMSDRRHPIVGEVKDVRDITETIEGKEFRDIEIDFRKKDGSVGDNFTMVVHERNARVQTNYPGDNNQTLGRDAVLTVPKLDPNGVKTLIDRIGGMWPDATLVDETSTSAEFKVDPDAKLGPMGFNEAADLGFETAVDMENSVVRFELENGGAGE